MKFITEAIFGIALRGTHPGMWSVFLGTLEAPFGCDKDRATLFCIGERLIHFRQFQQAA